MRQPFSIELATIADRETRGGNSLYIAALSPDAGFVQAMKKISFKKASQMPDLFDDVSVEGEISPPSTLKFAREITVLKRRGGIADDYSSFEQASLIAQTILKNARHIENSRLLSQRLRAALDSIAEGAPPEIVRLKFMYLLARDEGYAVREDFFKNLTEPKKALFSELVKRPSKELSQYRSLASDILGQLCGWIRSETDITD